MTDKTELYEMNPNDPNNAANMGLLKRAYDSAEEMVRQRYPKTIALKFMVKLKVGFDHMMLTPYRCNFVVIRRQNRSERREMNNKIITSGGKFSDMDVIDMKLSKLITEIGYQDDNGGTPMTVEWGNIPEGERKKILNNLDMIDEDEIMEGMTALENGYGNLEDFYASGVYKSLKEESDRTFQDGSE